MIPAVLLTVAAAIILYTVAAYPLLLRGWRHMASPVQRDSGFRTRVSVIVAVYNGEAFARRKLESLLAQSYPPHLVDILVISDGSTDRTDGIVESFVDRGIRLIRVSHGGKAAAINTALGHASGEILFFTDIRQELDRDALSHLVSNFADRSVGAVTGELRLVHSKRVGQEADMDVYWRYELWARDRHSAIYSILNTTGCIYALRRCLAEPIPPDTLGDDLLVPLRALLRGYRVIFDRRAVAFDPVEVSGGEFRRKLRTLAALWQICVRLPKVFTRSNPMLIHFLSHKFARVVLPWSCLLAIAATLALHASQVRKVLLACELAVVPLAFLDWFLPKQSLLRRCSSPARSFLTMNVAALCSVLVFFVRPEILWRPTRIRIEPAEGLLNRRPHN